MLCLSSRVSAVTVFRHGAVVTRQVELVQPEQGWPNQLRLIGLPLALADQSLRIRASFPQGGGGLLATDLRVDLDWQEPEAPPPLNTEDLLPRQGEIRRLRAHLDALNQDLARLEAMQPANRPAGLPGQPPPGYALESRRNLVQLRQKLLSEGLAKRNELQQRLEVLAEELRQATTPPPPKPPNPLYKAVVVTLRTLPESHAGAVCLELSYEVSGARWAPSYTLRFDRDFTMAELAMRAHLVQSSGEDWNGVKLQVSTADIAAWKELPELPSRRIGRQQARPHRPGWRPAPPNTDSLFSDYDRRPTTRAREEFSEPVAWDAAPEAPASDPFASADPFAAPPPADACFAAMSAPEPHSGDWLGAAPAAFGFAERRSGSAFPAEEGAPAPRSGLMARSDAPPPARAMPKSAPAPVPASKPMLQRAPAPGGGGRAQAPPIPPPPQRPGAALNNWQPMEPPALELSSEQLAYGLLYMPGPGERGRGRLQARSPLEACLQLWAERYPRQPFDARRQIEDALRRSRQALSLQAPRDHSFPGSVAGFDYLYSGESPIDLASDVQFHSVPLLTRQLPTQLLWLVVPKVTCDVFRRAKVESLPDLAFPAGPVDVYVGHDYLATTQLANVAPGEAFSIGLGVEQSVKVVRNTAFKESTAGMMGGTLQLRHEVTVEAANQLQREVRLEVQEALPQTAADDIKVKLDSCDPPWDALPDQPGGWRWSLRIPAGETRQAQLSYLIEMPSKLELVGGNRREE